MDDQSIKFVSTIARLKIRLIASELSIMNVTNMHSCMAEKVNFAFAFTQQTLSATENAVKLKKL